MRLGIAAQPSRLHSLCYLFQDSHDHADLLWHEADKQPDGTYRLRKFVMPIKDPESLKASRWLSIRARLVREKAGLKPDKEYSGQTYDQAEEAIIDWDNSMERRRHGFNITCMGPAPKIFSHHPVRSSSGSPPPTGIAKLVASLA